MAAAAVLNMSPTTSPLPTKRRSSPLSIDLSDLPPLVQPSPPTNTLLLTNLQAPEIFTGAILDNIRTAIAAHATIHTFAPLKSFRRIVVSFLTTEDAVAIRQRLDGETVLGCRVRVYFGVQTRIEVEDQHLQAPKAGKLFFISPPPSPPMGWEMRDEAPPNKEVHAEDLATALARLRARPVNGEEAYPSEEMEHENGSSNFVKAPQRSRSSTVVFDPQDDGRSPDLPAIAVIDTSQSPGDLNSMEGVEKKFVHTSRPPVELMED